MSGQRGATAMSVNRKVTVPVGQSAIKVLQRMYLYGAADDVADSLVSSIIELSVKVGREEAWLDRDDSIVKCATLSAIDQSASPSGNQPTDRRTSQAGYLSTSGRNTA